MTRMLLGLLAALPAFAASCDSLSSLRLPNTTVTMAKLVEPGAFSPPAAPPNTQGNPFRNLPKFCRVVATLTPTADSDIKIEVWLPAANWNGKFQAVGNGGWAGVISYPAMAQALNRGYATASTDTGHATPGAEFAMNHPEKLIDFGHRAVHEMTVQAKAIVAGFYGGGATRAYWNGCSTGGRQGLMEAQRYPADFDGIIAGAPANYMSHLQTWSMWVASAAHQTDASYIPPTKYPLIHKAALAACDALDGVEDGVIEDPTRCHFDPKALQCTGSDTATCLTAPQVEAARKIYAPAVSLRNGLRIFPGLEPGSELGWAGLAGPRPLGISNDTFRYVVHGDPAWDWKTMDFDADTFAVEKRFGANVDATNPQLSSFTGRGGKLIMYQGWNDQLIAPRNSIDYFNNAVYTMGITVASEALSLYMVPGMNHCNGGDGTTQFDMVHELENWVERGVAPDRIIARRQNPTRSRPLCPYPKVAVYNGKGSTDDAANFVCEAR